MDAKKTELLKLVEELFEASKEYGKSVGKMQTNPIEKKKWERAKTARDNLRNAIEEVDLLVGGNTGFKVGDRVRYSAEFLDNSGCTIVALVNHVGKVVSIDGLRRYPVCYVQWDGAPTLCAVAIENLQLA